MSGETVKVFAARDSTEAQHVQRQMAIAGIRAIVMGENLSIAWGASTLNQETLPSVWVNVEDAERAMKVVDDWIGPGDRPPEDVVLAAWQCPLCGEEVEGQFAACWNCGLRKPEEAVS